MVKTPPCSKYEPPKNITYKKNDKLFCRKIANTKTKLDKKTRKYKKNIPNRHNVLIEEEDKNINGENIKMIDFSWKKSVFINIWICDISNILEESFDSLLLSRLSRDGTNLNLPLKQLMK